MSGTPSGGDLSIEAGVPNRETPSLLEVWQQVLQEFGREAEVVDQGHAEHGQRQDGAAGRGSILSLAEFLSRLAIVHSVLLVPGVGCQTELPRLTEPGVGPIGQVIVSPARRQKK